MKSRGLFKLIAAVFLIAATGGLGWAVFNRFQDPTAPKGGGKGPQPAPVEAAEIQHGPIEMRRVFSGTLESAAEFVAAPKVSGRIVRLVLDIADSVQQNQVVAELDNDEYLQAVAQAHADLAVAKANRAEAESALTIAARELKRIKTLRERGVMSDAHMDTAQADQLEKQARLEVAKAQVTRAEAALESAKIRLGYTRVVAGWTGGNGERVVAERYVNEGETVSANAPLLSIVELNPIVGVIFVTERDYASLQPGQPVVLTTDAYPSEVFQGRIERIAPVFRQTTRQARVELKIENPKHRLKPGMFIRAEVVLDRMAHATIIPEEALTYRNDNPGVFVVNEDSKTVTWRGVTVGIREAGRMQVEGEGLTGRVITLGQQLVDDGSEIMIPTTRNKTASTRDKQAAQ
jgi:RND family efflux transporter MFP subunit